MKPSSAKVVMRFAIDIAPGFSNGEKFDEGQKTYRLNIRATITTISTMTTITIKIPV